MYKNIIEKLNKTKENRIQKNTGTSYIFDNFIKEMKEYDKEKGIDIKSIRPYSSDKPLSLFDIYEINKLFTTKIFVEVNGESETYSCKIQEVPTHNNRIFNLIKKHYPKIRKIKAEDVPIEFVKALRRGLVLNTEETVSAISGIRFADVGTKSNDVFVINTENFAEHKNARYSYPLFDYLFTNIGDYGKARTAFFVR